MFVLFHCVMNSQSRESACSLKMPIFLHCPVELDSHVVARQLFGCLRYRCLCWSDETFPQFCIVLELLNYSWLILDLIQIINQKVFCFPAVLRKLPCSHFFAVAPFHSSLTATRVETPTGGVVDLHGRLKTCFPDLQENLN